eukprot:SAG31_NODE_8506_length_1439_cov_1.579104_1_plen_321_part_10
MHQTVAEGWTVEAFFDEHEEFTHKVYTNLETKHQITVRRRADGVFQNDDTIPRCKRLMDVRPDLAPFLGTPTHLLSHPWDMSLADIVEAVENALEGSDAADSAFFWFGMLSENYHNHFAITEDYLQSFQNTFKSVTFVQVCSSWNDPERLGRLWMLYETCFAVANDRTLLFGFSDSEQSALADALRTNGPDAILTVVFRLEIQPGMAKMHREDDRSHLTAGIAECASQCGGNEDLDLQLREKTRQTYAGAIDREFERRWALVFRDDTSSSVAPPANLEEQWQALDLGHQLACLWAMTDAADRSEVIFRRVLQRLKTLPTLS